MIGNTKSIYHSTLTKAGDVTVTVKSDVLTSKYKKPGEPGYHYVVIEHDGDEQTYSIENDHCKGVFEGQKGNTVTIRATGARGDAVVELARDAQAPAKAAQQQPAAPTGDPAEAFEKAAMPVLNAFYLIERMVARQSDQSEIDGVKVDPASFGGKCGQLFRFLDGLGLVKALPYEPLWSAKQQ